MERISLLQVSAVRQSAPDSFVLFFRRSQSCFEPDVNILQPVKEVLVMPSAEFQDLDHHLKTTVDLQDPPREFQSSIKDAATWVDAIDRVIRTLHHHLEIPAEHGFLVPTRIHLKKSAFPKFKAGTRPFFVGIRIRDKVVSSEPFADASSLNEIHYFMASPVSYLTIAMYDGVEKFGKWAGSVAQTVNQANDNTNDLRLNIIDEVYLQTNVSFSRVFPRAIAAVEAAFQTGIPNDALFFLGVHLGQGSPANKTPSKRHNC